MCIALIGGMDRLERCKVSHRAKRGEISVAKSRNIPVYLRHSRGVCTLRRCMDCMKPEGVNG